MKGWPSRVTVFALAVVVGALAATVAVGADEPAAPLRLEDLVHSPSLPPIRVLDTESSLGPLASQPQVVTVEDLVRYHGHACDGLAVAAAGIAYGLKHLFPEGVVDRTDVLAAVNGSACYGDVAAYLTGARVRYGTLVVDASLGDEWVLARRSTGQTVKVAVRAGLRPPDLTRAENELRQGGCDAVRIAQVQQAQRGFAMAVLGLPPAEAFVLTPLPEFGHAVGAGRPDIVKARCGEKGR